jgi:hypothetical protein
MKDYRRFISFIVLFTAGFYWLNNKVQIPYLSASAIAAVLFLIFIIWDRYLWKKKRFYISFLCSLATGLYDYPDLSGKWKVKYFSSYKYDEKNDKYTTEGEGEVKISQCYSTLNIEGVFGASSKFESVIANLKQKESERWMLVYAYRNTPTDTALASSKNGGMHMGFCYLELSDDQRKLEGFYSNDEQRKTRGKITLQKL